MPLNSHWTTHSHTYASIIKQYNLIVAKQHCLRGWEGQHGPGRKQWQPYWVWSAPVANTYQGCHRFLTKKSLWWVLYTGCPLFFNNGFPWLFHDISMTKINENPWSIGTAYFSKWTIYDLWMHTRISSDSCSCSSYYCQEEKITHIYKYFTTVCPTWLHSLFLSRISQCSCKNSMTLSSFSRTFHDLCCFPWPSMTGK